MEIKMVNIEGLDRGEVFASLYNNAKVLGMGVYQAIGIPMTQEEAYRCMHDLGPHFDYVYGKPMKLHMVSDENEIDVRSYDHYNGGDGTAERVIDNLRKNGFPAPDTTCCRILKLLRLTQGLSIEDLANKMEVPVDSILEIEDKGRIPRILELTKFAEAFEIERFMLGAVLSDTDNDMVQLLEAFVDMANFSSLFEPAEESKEG